MTVTGDGKAGAVVPMSDAPDETQKLYRAAALRILAQIEDAAEDEDISLETKKEALLYTAEALVDLAETLMEGHPVAGTSGT